jgi:hypothetical protein
MLIEDLASEFHWGLQANTGLRERAGHKRAAFTRQPNNATLFAIREAST